MLRLRLPDLPELEFIFQAEEILSTKPHPQAEIVDLPYCLLCCSQFLQALKKLFVGIRGLVVFELQWIPVPFVMRLPGPMPEDCFVCPGHHSKTGILEILVKHPLTLCRGFFSLEQRRDILAYLLVRGLKLALQVGLLEQ